MSFYSVGLSALNAAQFGLTTAGHNIANASTPGYHRQEILQSNATPLLTGSGFIGQGVNVNNVRRQLSQYLETQLKQVQTSSAQLTAYLSQINPIDNALGGSDSGLDTSLQAFFTGVSAVSNDPASVPARQALLSDGSALVSKFQSLATNFSQIRSGLDTQLSDSVQLINSYASQIANLNQQIALQSAGGPADQVPNDLLDQREQLISKLNKEVGTTTLIQSDGSASLFFSSGQPLVIENQTFPLTASQGKLDPQHLDIGYQMNATTNVPVGSSTISGGTIGGLLAFRDQTLDVAENSLGKIAIAIATAVNNQQALGQDFAGNSGGNFFSITAGNVQPNTTNAGTGVVTTSVANVQFLTTSDYRLDITAAGGTVTRLSDNAQTKFTTAQLSAGATVDGATITMGLGTIAGDSYLIRPTRTGASSISLSASINTTTIAAAAPISTLATLGNTGTGKISPGLVNSPNDKVTLTFTGAATFTASDATTGSPLINPATGTTTFNYVSGNNITINGWTAQISGAAVVGDVFQVDKGVSSKTGAGAGSGTSINNPIISVLPINANLQNSVTVTFSSTTAAGTAAAAAVPAAAGTIAATLANITTAITAPAGLIYAAAVGAVPPASAAQAQLSGTAILNAAQVAAVQAGATPASVTAAAKAAAGVSFLEYSVTGTGSGLPSGALAYDTTTGTGISYNGWSATITGVPKNSDTFKVGPNVNGTSDNRNALAIAALESLSTMNNGSASFEGAYAQMVSLVGNKTSEIQVTSDAQTQLVQQTQTAQQSISGVNLDEEAANLLRYQQAYQAAGKMMQIATTIFDTLLSIGN